MKWLRYGALSLAGLILLAFLILFVLSSQKDASTLRASVEIARTPQQLAPWLEDPEKIKQWVSWLKEIRRLTPPPHGVGTKEVWVMEDRNNNNQTMELKCEVIAFEPLRRAKVRITAAEGFTGISEFITTDLGNGHTRFDQIGEYTFDSAFVRLMTPIVMRSAAAKALADMQTLKAKVEAAPVN